MTLTARRLTAIAVGAALSGAALFILTSSVDLAATAAALGRARIEWLIPVALVLIAQFSVRTLRWSLVAVSLRPEAPVPATRFAAPLAIGYLGNAVLPARLGEVVRAAILARSEGLPVASVLGTVLVERVADTLTLAALAGIVASAMAPEWIARLALAVALVAVALLIFLIAGGRLLASALRSARSGWLKRVASMAGGAIANIVTSVAGIPRRVLLVVVALSAVGWIGDALLFWLVAIALGVDLALPLAFLVGAVAVLGTAVPSLPGYVGTFEAAAVAAAVALGVRPGDALALAVLAHAYGTVPVATLGAIALARRGLGRADLLNAASARRSAPSAIAR